VALGQFDSNSPYIDIHLAGPFTTPVPVRCLMDTGFTGFLLVPIIQALPLGLVLTGTTSVTLADGQSQVKLVCLGQAEIDGITAVGAVVLEPNAAEILAGIDFLRRFNLRLVVDPLLGHIELVPSVSPVPSATTIPAPPVTPPSPPANP
jgi:predicted aspartyl protease